MAETPTSQHATSTKTAFPCGTPDQCLALRRRGGTRGLIPRWGRCRHSMGMRARPDPHGTTAHLPAPPHPWLPLLPFYLHPQRLPPDLHSGFSSALKSWLMATSCNLVTSETMTMDFRRSSMCTDCHSPVGSKSHLESSHAFRGVLLSAPSRDTPHVPVFQYTATE